MKKVIGALSIVLLLSSTPFLQITPALGIDLTNLAHSQNSRTHFRGYMNANGQSSSGNSNPLIQQFLSAWDSYSNLTTMVDKSIVVGLMTAQTTAIRDTVVSAGLDRGTTNSLVAKLDAAHDRAGKAYSYVLTVQPKLVNNMLNASDNQLASFINEVQALQGKEIPQQLANSLVASAQNLIHDSTLSGSSLVPLIPLTDLTLFNQLFEEIQTANQAVQVATQNLTDAGFSVTVKFDSITLLLCGGALVGCLLIAAGATAIALSLTSVTVNQMAAKGHPLSNDKIAELSLITIAFFNAVAFGLFALGEVLAPLLATAVGEAIGALPVTATTASVLARIYADHAIEAFVATVFGQQIEQSILGLIGATLTSTTIAITITNTQSSATPTNFTQMLHLNPSNYASNLASNLGNIRFFSNQALTQHLPAWLENASSTPTSDTNDIVWVNMMNDTIAASSSVTIFMVFEPKETTFDSNFWGEAPQLSTTYSTPSVNSQSSNSATNTKSVTCTVNVSNIGDLLYAQIVPDQLPPAGVTVTDSQNNHYSFHSQTGIFVAWVAAVAASATGSDTITFSNTNTIPALDIFCYDVSGVSTTLRAFSQTSASGAGPSTIMTVPAFNTFSRAPGFTAALYDEFTSRSVTITAGAGFSPASGSPINDGFQLMASQYSTTTTGSTQCPTSVSASESWIAECDNFAPTPSAGSYGRHDNGAKVFAFYDDFAGTTLNSAKWNAPVILSNPDSGPASFSVSDGLTLSATGASIAGGPFGAVHVYSKNTYSNNVYDVYYGQESDSCPGGCRQDTEAFLGALLTPPISTCHPTTGPSACAGHGTGYLAGWGTFFPWIIIGATPANRSLFTTTNAAWPNAPFTLYWQSGSEILYAGYTQRLSWTDTSNAYGANFIELDTNAWRGSIAVTAFWARARAIPPNNVMPSVVFGSP